MSFETWWCISRSILSCINRCAFISQMLLDVQLTVNDFRTINRCNFPVKYIVWLVVFSGKLWTSSLQPFAYYELKMLSSFPLISPSRRAYLWVKQSSNRWDLKTHENILLLHTETKANFNELMLHLFIVALVYGLRDDTLFSWHFCRYHLAFSLFYFSDMTLSHSIGKSPLMTHIRGNLY